MPCLGMLPMPELGSNQRAILARLFHRTHGVTAEALAGGAMTRPQASACLRSLVRLGWVQCSDPLGARTWSGSRYYITAAGRRVLRPQHE